MEQALELAGLCAAHGMWCVSELLEGEALIPMLAQIDQAGTRSMSRLEADRIEDSVDEGKKQLIANPSNSACAVLVYDGYMTLPTGKTDALFLEIKSYINHASLTMGVPYRSCHTSQGFAVHRPKFLAYEGSGSPNYSKLGETFFEGVNSHSQGSAVWSAALDESI